MGQCTHDRCTEEALPGSNRCALHGMEGSRSDKMSELAMGDVAEGAGLGGLGTRGRAPTGGYGSIYGYMTQEFKASKTRSWVLPLVVVVVAVVAYVVMRLMAPAQGP
jgi:hypothetical protein